MLLDRAQIIERIRQIEIEFGTDGINDTRGMQCRGASEVDIARDNGRFEGRQDVIEWVRSLLTDIDAR